MRDALMAGMMADTTVMTTPTISATMSALQQAGHQDAGGEADQRGDDADDHGLRQQAPDHLTPAGADGPQQRRLPLPLGHDDGERVVDGEGGHEQRDSGEDQQQDVEELQGVLDVGLVLLGDLRPREHLDAVGADGLAHPVGQLGLAHRAVALAEHGVDLTGLADERLGGGQVEQRERGAAGRVGVAEADVADDRELLAAALADDRDGIADLELAVLEALAVEHDLVRAGGQLSVMEPPG